MKLVAQELRMAVATGTKSYVQNQRELLDFEVTPEEETIVPNWQTEVGRIIIVPTSEALDYGRELE